MAAKIMELSWAAGFFDGEGNTRFRKDGALVMQIGQIDRQVLDRFLSAVRLGSVLGPYKKKERAEADYFTFQVTGEKAIIAFSLIRPFLSPVKQKQGDGALQQYLDYHNECPDTIA